MTDNEIKTDGKPLIHAATVLLLRDGGGGLEVFMVVRHHEIDSFSGALVFPGGKVDKGDLDGRPYCLGEAEMTDRQISTRVGAIREAFEECGVLLALEDGAEDLVSAARVADLERQYRLALRDGEIEMAVMCEVEKLKLAVDRLTRYAHWVTPPFAPKIFDTHFYLAKAPVDHVALHDGEESTDSEWLRPADAIALAEAGERTLVFPTRMNLVKLSRFDSVEAALAGARAGPVVSVQPRMREHEEGRVLCIPEEAGYGGSEFLVSKQGTMARKLA